jgi:propanol-preferring alcohol dehydrogenase
LFIDIPAECDACQIHSLHCEKGNQKMQGFGIDCYFAEYCAIDYHNAIEIPASMDMKTSAPLFCAGVTGTSPSPHPP